ncbi:MAG: hypothetical protein WC458_04135 [Patescibacteria group bacterium]
MALLNKHGGATWYVATTGSDTTGDGSSGNPWATPPHAWDGSTNGWKLSKGTPSL